jgi:hypothetical protein
MSVSKVASTSDGIPTPRPSIKLQTVYGPRRCESQGCARILYPFDKHSLCIACLGDLHNAMLCPTCKDIPEPMIKIDCMINFPNWIVRLTRRTVKLLL